MKLVKKYKISQDVAAFLKRSPHGIAKSPIRKKDPIREAIHGMSQFDAIVFSASESEVRSLRHTVWVASRKEHWTVTCRYDADKKEATIIRLS